MLSYIKCSMNSGNEGEDNTKTNIKQHQTEPTLLSTIKTDNVLLVRDLPLYDAIV